MPKLRMSDAWLKSITVEQPTDYFDQKQPRLVLRVSPGGTKTWRVLFYEKRPNKAGDLKTLARTAKLGRYPDLNLKEARSRARDFNPREWIETKAQVETQAQAAATQDVTYGTAVEKYIETYQIKKKDNRTASEVRRLLLKEGAAWLDRPVNEITRRDIHDLLDRIMERGTPYVANRTFAALRTFFSWCVARDKIEHSPCEGVEKPFDREKPRERHYDDDEIKSIWNAADTLDGPRGAFLKIMLLTGKRRGEVAGLTWDELDLDDGIWTLPASRTKNQREHKMPLPALAVRILKAQPRSEGSPLVFPGRHHGRPMNGWSVFKRAAEKASGISDFTFHACRHTLKTRLGKLGIPPHVKDKVMHHAPPRSAGEAYDHYDYLLEQREAIERWAAHVEAVVQPKGVTVLR